MSHKSIRKLIEDTARSLQDDIQYSYGKDTDFNQEKKKSFTLINTSPLTATPAYRVNGTSNYMKQWNVEMAFYSFDVESSIGSEYSEILDRMDPLVDQFINKLNFFSLKSDSLIIQGINQTPFIKVTADILTGYILTFQLIVNDDFDYCSINDC